MVNLEPDPDDIQFYLDNNNSGDMALDKLVSHYEGIIEKQDKIIKDLEGIIEALKNDCSDKAY